MAGAFALSNAKNGEYCYYYRKTFLNVGVHVVNFSIFYFFVAWGFDFLKNNGMEIEVADVCASGINALKKLVAGAPVGPMWYLYMTIGLYFATPLIVKWKNEVGPKMFAKMSVVVACAIILADVVGRWISANGQNGGEAVEWSLSNSVNWLGYFLLGSVVRDKYLSDKSNKRAFLFLTLGTLVGLGICGLRIATLRYDGTGCVLGAVPGFFSPLRTIYSILFFAGFASLKTEFGFRNLAAKTFYIYQWRFFVLLLVSRVYGMGILGPRYCWATITFAVVVTFLMSWGASFFYEAAWKRVDRNRRVSERLAKVFGLAPQVSK